MLKKVLFIVYAYVVLVESEKVVSKRCGLNEEWVKSVDLCPPTCEFRHPPCPRLGIKKQPGCQCKPGFILLNDVERFCVKDSTCPKTCSKQLFVWSDCGTRCPSTCLQPGTIACVRICEPGCFCPRNYLLNEFTMECVKWSRCPLIDPTA